MSHFVVLGLAAACIAIPAHAADVDRVAKRQLQQKLQADPDDPVVMAQLARVYLTTGSVERARMLYRAMLSMEEVMLEQSGGPAISSHALARRGLGTLKSANPVRLGSR